MGCGAEEDRQAARDDVGQRADPGVGKGCTTRSEGSRCGSAREHAHLARVPSARARNSAGRRHPLLALSVAMRRGARGLSGRGGGRCGRRTVEQRVDVEASHGARAHPLARPRGVRPRARRHGDPAEDRLREGGRDAPIGIFVRSGDGAANCAAGQAIIRLSARRCAGVPVMRADRAREILRIIALHRSDELRERSLVQRPACAPSVRS